MTAVYNYAAVMLLAANGTGRHLQRCHLLNRTKKKVKKMNVVARVVLGTASLMAVISLNNYIIDAESSVAATLAIAALYQAIVFFIGGVAGSLSTFAKSRNLSGPIIEDDPEDEMYREMAVVEQVNVTNVCHKEAKIIGNFQDEHIYDSIDVTFSNGVTLPYKFDTTIGNFKNGTFDQSALKGGALVLAPGIVYVPI